MSDINGDAVESGEKGGVRMGKVLASMHIIIRRIMLISVMLLGSIPAVGGVHWAQPPSTSIPAHSWRQPVPLADTVVHAHRLASHLRRPLTRLSADAAGETVVVPFANGETGVQTTQSYNGPVTLDIAGTGQAAGPRYSDGFYVYTDEAGNELSSPDHYSGLSEDWTLWINGGPADNSLPAIPPYNHDHLYTVVVTATGGPLSFAVGDTLTDDNTGAYTIKVTPGTGLQVAASASPPTFAPSGGGATTISAMVTGPQSDPTFAHTPVTVTATIYDSSGAQVKSFGATSGASNAQWTWDGRGDAGGLVSPGMYTAEISAQAGVNLSGTTSVAIVVTAATPTGTPSSTAQPLASATVIPVPVASATVIPVPVASATVVPVPVASATTASGPPLSTPTISPPSATTMIPIPPTPYPTPTHRSGTCVFDAVVAGWTLQAQICSAQESPQNATISPPNGLGLPPVSYPVPGRYISVEAGNNGSLHVTRIKLPRLPHRLRAGGFGFELGSASLVNPLHPSKSAPAGLQIDSATLYLPPLLSEFGQHCGNGGRSGESTVALSNVFISAALHILRGKVDTNGPIELSFAGAQATVDQLDFGDDGFSIGTLAVNLPSIFHHHGSGRADLSNFAIHSDGAVSGTLDDLDVDLGGIHGLARTVTLGRHGFYAASIFGSISTPVEAQAEIDGLSYDGHTFGFNQASGNITTGSFNIGRLQVASLKAALYLEQTRTGVMYDLSAGTSVTFPSVGQASAYVEMGTYPDRRNLLRHAHIDLALSSPLPIGETPFALSGVSGDLCVSGPCGDRGDQGSRPSDVRGDPIYILTLTGGVNDIATHGKLFTGSITGEISSLGDIGLGGHVALLKGFVTADAGVCILWDNRLDSVYGQYADDLCGKTIPSEDLALLPGGRAPRLAGLVLAASGQASLTLNKTAELSIKGAGYVPLAHSGDTSAARPVAVIVAHGKLPQGFAVDILPVINVNGQGELNTFDTPSDQKGIYGLKATTSGTFDFLGTHTVDFSFFVHQDGHLQAPIDAGSYSSQIDAGFPRGQSSTGAILPTGIADRRGGMRDGSATNPSAHGQSSGATRSATVRVAVAVGQAQIFLGIAYRRGAPRLTLADPTGVVYTPAAAHGGFYYTLGAASRTGLRATAFGVPHPRAGYWTVHIGNLTGLEQYRVERYGNPVAPTIAVTSPGRGQTLSATAAHGVVTLRGTVGGVHARAAVSLYAITSRTVRLSRTNGVANTVGLPIAVRIPVIAGHWSYRWNTSQIAPGRYAVVAQLDNGTGPLVTATSAGSVVILVPRRPIAPQHVRAVDDGRQITVRWSAPTQSGDVAGYIVRVRELGRRGGDTSTDVGVLTSFRVLKRSRTARYAISIQSYDTAGHRTLPVAVRITARRLSHAKVSAPSRPRRHGRAAILSSASPSFDDVPIDSSSTVNPVRTNRATPRVLHIGINGALQHIVAASFTTEARSSFVRVRVLARTARQCNAKLPQQPLPTLAPPTSPTPSTFHQPVPTTPPTNRPTPTVASIPTLTPLPVIHVGGFIVGPYGTVRGTVLGYQAHHIIQDAAVERVVNGRVVAVVIASAAAPLYNTNRAPTIMLSGYASRPPSEHYNATRPQVQPSMFNISPKCGDYELERRIGEQGLLNVPLSTNTQVNKQEADVIMAYVDTYFKQGLKFTSHTSMLCPGNRK